MQKFIIRKIRIHTESITHFNSFCEVLSTKYSISSKVVSLPLAWHFRSFSSKIHTQHLYFSLTTFITQINQTSGSFLSIWKQSLQLFACTNNSRLFENLWKFSYSCALCSVLWPFPLFKIIFYFGFKRITKITFVLFHSKFSCSSILLISWFFFFLVIVLSILAPLFSSLRYLLCLFLLAFCHSPPLFLLTLHFHKLVYNR